MKKGARFTHSTHPFSGEIELQLLCYSLLARLHCKLEAMVEGTTRYLWNTRQRYDSSSSGVVRRVEFHYGKLVNL